MLKVNAEKLLQDYEAIRNKQNVNLQAIEQEAKAFAVARGYNEAQTVEFIKLVQGVELYGLAKEERERLEILREYVYEAEDVEPLDDEEIVADGAAEADNGAAVDQY